jgi:CheY-like chemotaxis protein
MSGAMPTIFVIDDDRAILEVLTLVLEGEGYRVIGDTGDNIDQLLTAQLPGVVLLDIWLQGLDGREIAKRLKSDARYCHIPLILMSAHSQAAVAVAETGADAFLEKPFEVEHLIQLMRHFLT